LGQLALALLNATLLLALAVIFAAIVLVTRIENAATDTARAVAAAVTPEFRNRVETGLDRVSQTLARLDGLDAHLAQASATGDAAPQLQALRDDVAALTIEVAELNTGLHELRASAIGGLRNALRDAMTDAAAALDTAPLTKDTP
jgi:hypothetical protein